MESPTLSPRRRPRGFFRRIERACWWAMIRVPLVLVYGLTTWAVWSATNLALLWRQTSPSTGTGLLVAVVTLYILLNWSYSVCAFIDPGSPLSPPPASKSSSRGAYTELPTFESTDPSASSEIFGGSMTVKSSGGARFCKKCQARKPDRTHHCSTCRRCVLKMDHHCPWIATCVGFRNYKAFVLFITYVTLFCYVCEAIAGTFLWYEFYHFVPGKSQLSVNMILLSVLAGLFALVMTGFTGWHYHLALKNQTTIECLEKTRYLGPLQKRLDGPSVGHQGVGRRFGDVANDDGNDAPETEGLMQKYGEQLRSMHANAIPGVTRIEEGEEHSSEPGTPDVEAPLPHYSNAYNAPLSSSSASAPRSPNSAPRALGPSGGWAAAERSREQERYEAYLDERDSETLPNAFDLGWRRNLWNLFGPTPWLWPVPVCNSVGDGFSYAPNPAWVRAREALRHRREVAWKEQAARERRAGWGDGALYPVLQEPAGGAGRHYQQQGRQWRGGPHAVNATADSSGVLNEDHLGAGGEYLVTSQGLAEVPNRGRRSPTKADRLLGRVGMYADDVPLADISRSRRGQADDDTASLDGLYDGGEEDAADAHGPGSSPHDHYATTGQRGDGWQDWK